MSEEGAAHGYFSGVLGLLVGRTREMRAQGLEKSRYSRVGRLLDRNLVQELGETIMVSVLDAGGGNGAQLYHRW